MEYSLNLTNIELKNMLYFTIIAILIFFFIILWLFTHSIKKKKDKIKNIKINFEDIDSLNVSKIVVDDNDIDFIRNEFWFQYKQKQTLNMVSFNKLKKHFEEQNNINISNISLNSEITKFENKDLVDIIISDSNEKEAVAQAFRVIQQRFN